MKVRGGVTQNHQRGEQSQIVYWKIFREINQVYLAYVHYRSKVLGYLEMSLFFKEKHWFFSMKIN